jgi:very-short-patch-repair endonuclease
MTLAGMPLKTPARTAFDLGRRLSPVEAVVAVDAMLHKRLTFERELAALAAARPNWPRVRLLRTVLRHVEPKTESPMETRVRLMLVASGLPRPVAQLKLYDRDRRFVARLDLAYERQRLAVEYEGDHHRGTAAFADDLRRMNRINALGWTVLRFGARDVFGCPRQLVAAVHAEFRRRHAAGPASSGTGTLSGPPG